MMLQISDGSQAMLTLGAGRRASAVLWAARTLPQGRLWAAWATVALARLLGASVVPCTANYEDSDESLAYYQGFNAGFHDEPMTESRWPNAYTRGYWEGKRG